MLLAHMTTSLLYSDRGRLSGAHDESQNPVGVPSRQAAGLSKNEQRSLWLYVRAYLCVYVRVYLCVHVRASTKRTHTQKCKYVAKNYGVFVWFNPEP